MKTKTIDEICGEPEGTFKQFCKDNPDPEGKAMMNALRAFRDILGHRVVVSVDGKTRCVIRSRVNPETDEQLIQVLEHAVLMIRNKGEPSKEVL